MTWAEVTAHRQQQRGRHRQVSELFEHASARPACGAQHFVAEGVACSLPRGHGGDHRHGPSDWSWPN